MTTTVLDPLDDPKFVGFQKWLDDGAKDEPPIDARLAVSVSEDAAYSIVDYRDQYRYGDAESLGWDIKRQHGGPGGCGRDMFETLWILSSRGFRSDGWRREIDRLWPTYDRPRVPTDLLLIDVADEISHFGWSPPADVTASIESLRDMRARLHAERQARKAEEEERHYARVEAESEIEWLKYQAWLAAGEPMSDPLAKCHQERKRRTELQSLHEEFDQLDRWLRGELVELDDEDAIGALYLEYNEKVRLLQMRQDALVPQHNKVSTIVREAGGRLNKDPIPLTGTQRTVAELGQPVLDEFLAASTSVEASPSVDYPRLPETLRDHALFEQMNEAIERILALAEGSPKLFRQDRVLRCLAVLYAVHPDICERVVNRIIASGAVLSSGKFDSAVKGFETKVRREINTSAGFILDSRGNPDPANSDNVSVFLRTAGKRLRHNAWFQRNEIADADKENWRHLDEDGKDDLLVDAENSQFNYHPTKERFHRALNRIAREDVYDPVLERIDECARAWDSVPRLDHWLHHVCGVPDDEYHGAVSRNIIGGMIRRARHPGCKHDECAILISKQGTAKSTIAEILSLDPDWFTDSIEIGGRKVDIIPEMRGKWVIELQELSGMAKTEVERVKAFISTKKDNARLSYRTEASEPPRRCIFIGTSNDRRPLRDATGGRRFLPVYLSGHAEIGWLRAYVEQIIGEAAVREAAGESFAIPREIWSVAAEHQEAARQMSPLEEHVADLIGPFRTAACKVASADILEALRFRKCNDNKIGSAMERFGFTQPNRHDRIWVSKSATGKAKVAVALRLHRTLHEITFKFDGLPPPPH